MTRQPCSVCESDHTSLSLALDKPAGSNVKSVPNDFSYGRQTTGKVVLITGAKRRHRLRVAYTQSPGARIIDLQMRKMAEALT